jgi:hypothetical protein
MAAKKTSDLIQRERRHRTGRQSAGRDRHR